MEEREEFRTEFTEGEMAEVKAGIFDNAKEVNYPKLGKLYIKYPSVREDIEISRCYSAAFTRLLREGNLLTAKKFMEMLEESGLWTDKEEAEMKQAYELYISKTVSIEELKLKKRKTDEDKENLAQLEKERSKMYDKYLDLNLQKNMHLENTVEKQAEQEAILLKLTQCVYTPDNVRRWNSIDELQDENTSLEIDKLMTDAVLFWRGFSSPLSDILQVQ